MKRLTGEGIGPVLVLDDGEVVANSANIVAWAEAIRAAQRGGRSPASVTATSRRTAALVARPAAAVRVWMQ